MADWVIISACIFVLMILMSIFIIKLIRNRKNEKHINDKEPYVAITISQASVDKSEESVINKEVQRDNTSSPVATIQRLDAVGEEVTYETFEASEVPIEASLASIAIPHEELVVTSVSVCEEDVTYKTHATDGRLRFTCVSQDEFSVDKLFKNADMRGLVFHCDNCGRSLTKCVICGWLTCEDCHGGICYLCGNELYVDLKRNDFSTDSCTGVRLVPPSADYGKRIYYNVYDDNDEEDDYYFFEIDEIVDYLDEEHEKVGEFCYNCDELMTGICKSCGSYYCQNYTCEDVMDTCDLCGASLRSEDYDDYEPIDFDFFHWSDSHHSYNFTFTENKGNQTEKKELIATVRKANSTIIRGKKKMSLAKRIPISKAKEHKGTDLTINKVKAPVKSTAKTSVAKKRSKSAIKDKNISEVQLSALMEDQKQVLNDSRIGKKQHELDHEHDEVMIVNTRWHMEQNKRQYASSFFNRQGLIFDISEWFRWDPKIHNWTTQKKRILKGYEIFENNLFEKITRYSTTLGKCDCPDFIKRAKPCKHMYCIAIVVDVSLPISYDDYKNNLYMNIW